MNTSNNQKIAAKPLMHQVLYREKDYTVEVCIDQASLNTAFRVRYLANLAINAIQPNEEELLYDAYDFEPNAFIHLVWYQGKPVGTIRSSIYAQQYQWQRTEYVNYFQANIQRHFKEQTPLVESTRYAIAPDFQGRQSLFAQMLLFRTHALNAYAHNCKHVITAVRKKHIKFYERFLNMEAISSTPLYFSWVNAQLFLLSASIETCLEQGVRMGVPTVDLPEAQWYAACAKIPAHHLQTQLAA